METLAADLRTMIRTPLHPPHVAAMRKIGETVEIGAGETVVPLGAPADAFFYVEEGELEAIDPITGGRYGEGTLGPGQFFGEIGFLSGSNTMLGVRTIQPSRLLRVERVPMLALMSKTPEMSDIIVTVFAARRRRLLESDQASMTLLGHDSDRNLRNIAAFASRNRIPFRRVDLGSPDARDLARRCGIAEDVPAVLFGTTKGLVDPTPRDVAQLFGLDDTLADDVLYDVLIVGAGPAGVSAAVYAGAEGLKALVIEDLNIGGQAATSSRIENYMGFPTGISGADLCWRGEIQATKFGARFALPRRAVRVEKRADGIFSIGLQDGETVRARSVVVATGVQYRRLPLANLEHYEGAGIYYAATDLEARYCRDAEVAVIGGGNSAGQAAMFLSRGAAHVHLLVRSETLGASMSEYLVERLQSHPRITIHYRTEMTTLHGEDHLERVTIHDSVAGQDWSLATGAVFVMVGAAPNTDWLSGLVQLDNRGFVRTGREVGGRSGYETSHPGIFAVGDVRAGSVKRVASGVGEGAVVISKVFEHVNTV